ncbi:Tripartite-type tricarboxylate transporter, receptor component TctC [Saccharopolyspora kobensis]|uniref:Tripartite-type tricarboxylate transporter, receptor component TctC n=1 Tax=Saccharopolyspora kobensis TaxID=146035 RepID=A0A1H5T3G2_9PSEU|nr:tripartite tricarboxylate transporter substrate binding protein [Saccharopolyspora kobensis]SEF57353.1 Tripartite-type tricarboxylate transporter, receptor component TctC [Saccharopolyspora kobensis]SFC50764.1 Tripartite-type tricarboxylate transporter, receptor component TctC [Saccharopolyspora kobensis]
MTSKSPARRRVLPPALAAVLSLPLAACGGNLSSGGAEFPSGPVTMLVGQAPGGSTDLIGRALADGAADDLGVAMPVVNTPGANGALAANELAGEQPDGQHVLVLNASLTSITPLAVAPEEAVDINDYEVITGVSQDDYVLVANTASGLRSVPDLARAGRDLKFATTGVGTGSQLAQELLFEQAGIAGTAVPFDGGSPAMTAVLGSQVDVAAVQLGEAIGQIEAGRLTPLATFAAQRSRYLPETPTAVEQGYDVRVSQFRAIVAPKDTPPERVERLRKAFQATFATERYRKFNEDNLLTPHEVDGAQVVQEWTSSLESYRAMTRQHGIDLGGPK